MHTTWWVRGATLAVAGLAALLVNGTAWGDGSAALRSGQAPSTAAGFPAHSCDEDSGGGPYRDHDVWSFVLPNSTRQFIAVTASFDINGDSVADTAISAPAAGGIDDSKSTSKAWIVAPAAATLLNASAVTTGTTSTNPD